MDREISAAADPSQPPKRRNAVDVLAWGVGSLGVIALAVWSRMTASSRVFVDGETLLGYSDAYYHLRRTLQTLEFFPRVPYFDPFLNWPEGGVCPWPLGFDLLGATFAVALGVDSDAAASARALALLPVVLGVGCVIATALLGMKLAPAGSSAGAVALASGLAAALIPKAIAVSMIGRLDHHVAETLAMIALGAWALWALEPAEGGDGGGPRVRWIAFEAVGAVVTLAAATLFNGSIVYVAIAGSMLIGLRLSIGNDRGVFGVFFGSGATAFALAGIALVFVNRSAVSVHGLPFDFRYPSQLQPTLHWIAAFACGVAAGVATWRGRDVPSGRCVIFRTLGFALVGALGIGAFLFVLPPIAVDLDSGIREWLFRGDPWLASIQEFQPMIPSWRIWDPGVASESTGLFGVLGWLALPAAVVALRWIARDKPLVAAGFAFWSATLLALALVQVRFARVLTPNVAIVLALALAWICSTSLRSWKSAGRARLAGYATVGLLVLGALLDPHWRSGLIARPPGPIGAVESVSLHLRSFDAESDAPGVLAPWSWGHTVLALAGRPVVAAGFGPWPGEAGFREVEQALLGSEQELLELMERRRLGILVTGHAAFAPKVTEPDLPRVFRASRTGAPELNPPFFRSRALAPLLFGGSAIPALSVPNVPHLAPIFASAELHPEIVPPMPRVWAFEPVPGATLRGRATPGARVVASTELVVRSRSTRYSVYGESDESGRFALVTPVANDTEAGGIRTGAEYRVRSEGNEIGRIRISRAQVRAGIALELAAMPR